MRLACNPSMTTSGLRVIDFLEPMQRRTFQTAIKLLDKKCVHACVCLF